MNHSFFSTVRFITTLAAAGLFAFTARAQTTPMTAEPYPTGFIGQFERLLASALGNGGRTELLPGLCVVQLLMGVIVLLAVAVVTQALRFALQRYARRTALDAAEPVRGRAVLRVKMVVEALIPPLTLFLWSWGAYAAFSVVLGKIAFEMEWLADVLRWLKNAGEIGALFWFIFRAIRVLDAELKHWASGTDSKWDDVLVAVIVRAARLLVPLAGVVFLVPALALPESAHQVLRQASGLVLIGAVGFVLFQLVQTVETAVLANFRVDVRDNLAARKVHTQIRVLKKIAAAVIILFTGASMLMVFESVRQLGTSLLASAGLAGIIIGFAAQRSIATLLAGFQIAMTQPIRIDDVVIVEGEWGRIEEITLTYVVVVIWDQRRLVLPINYFIEKPFQNWTRVSAELLGTVFLHTDYTVALGPLREELNRILAETKLWDGRVKLIQVTDSKERTLELRVLVSAADAPTAWDLRCLVRERLVDFLQRTQPACLPRIRGEITGASTPNFQPA